MLVNITAGPNKGRRVDMPTSVAKLAIAAGWASTAELQAAVDAPAPPPRVNAPAPSPETTVAPPVAAPHRPRKRRR